MALTSLLDPLYCPEEHLEIDADASLHSHLPVSAAEVGKEPPEDWAEILSSLVAKEGETHPTLSSDGADDIYLRSARRGAVEWVARTAARHGFSALTVMLAVNYLDRCFLSGGGGLRLQGDRPWMGRLSAVACLSLAAKVEETYVPLLLDLQVAAVEAETGGEAEAGYVFEAKTVRRMELLVLSALGWRMNPVTPLSLIHLLLPRFFYKPRNGNLTSSAACLRCEAILLSVIADGRWVRYPASVWAAAAMRHALGQQLEPGIGAAVGGVLECHETHHLLAFLNAPKVEECFQLMLDCIGGSGGLNIGHGHKRKNLFSLSDFHPSPPSPNAVLGSCFSCESCDSWAMWPFSSASSSPELPPPKRPNCIATEVFGGDESGENGDRLHHHEPRPDCTALPI